jgi:ketosteroid isomerase-like protein
MTISESELHALLDKQAIQEVLARYVRAIDRRDAALLATVFHPDAVDHHVGHHTSAAQFCAWAIELVGTMGPVAHYLSPPLIELDGDVAHSECYAIAFHRLERDGEAFDNFLGARVLDRFERRASVWRIAVRRVVYDWNRDMPVSETWGRGFFPGFRAEGRKDRSDPLYAFLEAGPCQAS